MSKASRLRQGLQALIRRPDIPPDDALAVQLTEPQMKLFRELDPFDQAHLFRVYRRLAGAGETDADLLIAALLHDVGKVQGRYSVRLPDRVARVVFRRYAPGLLARLTRLPGPVWRMGLALAVHHPRLGAEKVAAVGGSARTCWLIAHHEDDPWPDDEALQRLMRADHAE